MEKIKKIGIMGGTFNPIHTGHLILAEAAYSQFELEVVYFMPSKNPPHKDLGEIVSDEHRSKMIMLAIKDNPHFKFSSLELEREGITYTVDTLEYLTEQNKDKEYYFIIGADSLYQIQTWRCPEKIFQMAHIVAATRYHLSNEKILEEIKYLNKEYDTSIEILHMPTIEISSKHIREKIKSRKSIKYYTPAVVEGYIENNKLYLA